MQLQTTRTFDAKGCRVDLGTWGRQIEIKGDNETVAFENVPQDQLRDAIRSFIAGFRYGSQDDPTADQWLETLTATVTDTIRERQNRKAKEAAA